MWSSALHEWKGQEGPQQGRRECSKDIEEPEQVAHAWPSSLPHTLERGRIQSHWNNCVGSVVMKHVQAVATDSVGDSSRCRDSNSSARSSSRSEDSTGTSRFPTVTGTGSCPGLQIPQTPTLELRKKCTVACCNYYFYNYFASPESVWMLVKWYLYHGHEQKPKTDFIFYLRYSFFGSYSHSSSLFSCIIYHNHYQKILTRKLMQSAVAD